MRKCILLLLLLSFFCILQAQKTNQTLPDSLFYNREYGLINKCSRKNAIAYSIKGKAFNTDTYVKRIFYLSNNKPLMKCVMTDTFRLENNILQNVYPQRNGDYMEWYENGQCRLKCTYHNDMLNGDVTFYRADGSVQQKEVWENGVWKSGQRIDSTGTHPTSNAYISEPAFPGGIVRFSAYLSDKIDKKHLSMRYDKLQKVVIWFIVNEKGGLEDIHVIDVQNPYFEKEIINIIKEMPDWRPGFFEGRPYRISYTLPFNFKDKEI
jgi:hypothetical protein